MKGLLIIAAMLVFVGGANAEDAKTQKTGTPTETQHPGMMKGHQAGMHGMMGSPEEMLNKCKEMHPGTDCESMMKSCSGKKDMGMCMEGMKTKKK